ncbi:MAG: hypothetical protein ACNYWU_02195 [Desulfobacterales bacterium]
MRATAKDLRFQSRELLNTVNRGEEVVITTEVSLARNLCPTKKKERRLQKMNYLVFGKNMKIFRMLRNM